VFIVIVVYLVIDTVRIILDTLSYVLSGRKVVSIRGG